MQGYYLIFVWLALVFLGLRAPFAFGLGYIWVDLFEPQLVNPGALGGMPVSLVMAIGAIGAYMLADRRAAPGLRLGVILPAIWVIWITLTTSWAIVPDYAWAKWDWAVKSVVFSIFMPFLFRSRVQIEAAILVIILSVSAHAIPFGLKTLVGGGGYEKQLGLVHVNFGFGESSTLANDCIAILPLLIWSWRHSLLVPRHRLMKLGYLGLGSVAVLTTLGTYARSGLLSLGIFLAVQWWNSKHKLVIIVVAAVLGAGLFSMMGDRYAARMATITTPTEDASAATRLAVWSWTLNFVKSHPLGGGFDVYRINTIDTGLVVDAIRERGRAFHSMYFEVLGEQGYVGAVIFVAMIGTFFISIMRIAWRTKRSPELAWMRDLAKAMMVSAAAYFTGAAFVGIAFQPFHYYLFALTVALLNNYARTMRTGALVERESLDGGLGQPIRQPGRSEPGRGEPGWGDLRKAGAAGPAGRIPHGMPDRVARRSEAT